MLIDSHLLDNGKLDKEYSLNNKIQLNEYSCMDIPNAVYNKLRELEDVLEKYGIESAEELDGVLKPLIDNGELENWKSAIFWKTQTERLEQELAELKQKAIVLPKELQVGGKIFWANEYGVFCGKLCAVTKNINPDGKFNLWLYCIYDNGLSYSHLIEDFKVELFATKEEAEQKLAEIREKDE